MISLLALTLLLAAPEADPAKDLLRVAWASQYEWKEDDVKNVTFDFEWNYRRTGLRPEDERKRTARGTIVIEEGEVARVHIVGANRSRVDEIRRELPWILSRFVRKPFEEQFKEMKFTGPEEISGGRKLVRAGTVGYLIKDDRIVGRELNFGSEKKPFRVRLDATVGDLGEGYAIQSESRSYERNNRQTTQTTSLKFGAAKGIPAPTVYLRESSWPGNKTTVELRISAVRFNTKDAVALNPELRDAVKAAWEQRHRIPAGTRVDAQWERKPDTALIKARWTRKVQGEMQLLHGKLEVILDEKLKMRARTLREIGDRAKDHLKQALDLVLERPFDVEFLGCGFERDADDETAIVIHGHPRYLAVRIEKELISATREDFFGEMDWSLHTYKKARDGRYLIKQTTRKTGKKKWKVNYRFTRKGELYVPKLFEVLVSISRFGINNDPEDLGVLSYEFRKVSVKPADG